MFVAKKSATADRKARLEEIRREQAAVERRRTLLIGGVTAVVVIGLVAAVGIAIRNQVANRDITRIGVAAAAADCDPATTDKTSGASIHVGPGTNQPNLSTVKYATVPPSSGQHFASPESPARAFYTASDRPRVENLVHNLEHGYTVLWYSSKLPSAQVDELKKLAPLARKDGVAGPKFIVSAWDDAYGALPADKPVALSHWAKTAGHRQLCGQVSGAAIKNFVKQFPSTDSTEPDAG
jgi:hypothetical protein